jgi:hypothetical protein
MSNFFLQHKDLFEYDKLVGGSGHMTSSTPSFLDRYRECDRQQAAPEMTQLATMGTVLRLDAHVMPPPDFSISTFAAPSAFGWLASRTTLGDLNLEHTSCPPAHSTSLARGSPIANKQPVSPSRRVTDFVPTGSFDKLEADRSHRASRSTINLLGSPRRRSNVPVEGFRSAIPKLNELLIDASTRAGLVVPTKRLDDAKKIELLIGSKCVGRLSAAASSNLPPSIRHRLEASAVVHQRRERLCALLRDDYERLTK